MIQEQYEKDYQEVSSPLIHRNAHMWKCVLTSLVGAMCRADVTLLPSTLRV